MDILLQQLANGLMLGVAYALVATGLALIFGIMGVVNFAHGEFYMLGAYGTALLMAGFGLSYVAAGALSLVGVVLLGLLVQRLLIEPLVRSHPLNTLLCTFALSIFIHHVVVLLAGSGGRQIESPFSEVVHFGPVVLPEHKLLVLLAGCVIFAALALFLKFAPIGKLMRATAQNRHGAAVLGVNVRAVQRFTFGFGIALAALGGVLLGPLSPIVPEMGGSLTLKGFAVIVLGGMGSVGGAILAAIILGIVEALAAGYLSSSWKDIFAFIVLVGVLVTRPTGLFGRAST